MSVQITDTLYYLISQKYSYFLLLHDCIHTYIQVIFIYQLILHKNMAQKYIANTIVMVKPNHFRFNSETSLSNAFQNKPSLDNNCLQDTVMTEFYTMVAKIRANDITVITLESNPDTPDAVFPNNWFSTHIIDNQHYIFIYPMCTENRRKEVQIDNLESELKASTSNDYKVLDLRGDYSKFLESTGVLIFDHEYKTAYMSISPRADATLAKEVCDKLGYKLITFTSHDKKGPIYHTNVMLSICENLAIICSKSIKCNTERKQVLNSLQKSNKEIVDISLEQMYQMCGNVLELTNANNQNFTVLSASANNGFTAQQIEVIDKYTQRIICDIPNIENVGGGSARCMMAEVFTK